MATRHLSKSTGELAELLKGHVFKGGYVPYGSESGEPVEYHQSGWDAWAETEGEWESVNDLGSVRVVENFGGEGLGDDCFLVFEVADGTGARHFFKLPGYYTSYQGGYYDGQLYEVKPVERKVTVYEPIE